MKVFESEEFDFSKTNGHPTTVVAYVPLNGPINLDIDDINSNLKDLLGFEKNGDWINFMREMHRLCPFLDGKGRSRKRDIEQSIIGLSGCKNLEEYLQQNLKWNLAGWNAWKKAYRLVNQHPYLCLTNASASCINTTYQKLHERFPKSIEEWDAYRNSFKSKSVESNSDLNDALHAIQKELTKINENLDSLNQARNEDRHISSLLYIKALKSNSNIESLAYKIDKLTYRIDASLSDR